MSIDLIIEKPTSHYGNKYILLMVDHLTSWPMVKAIRDKEATTIGNAIFEKLILEHGSMEILLSENGKEFTNDTLAYVCQEFGNEQHFTSPYTPRSNAKTTNFNKFLKASIRKLRQRFMGSSSWPNSVLISVAHTPLLVGICTHVYTIEIHQCIYII